MIKKELIMILGKLYSLDILEVLLQGPKRFTDLSRACPVEKTRAKRLKEFKNNDLIEAIVRPIGKRNFIHYNLTRKGKEVISKVKEF